MEEDSAQRQTVLVIATEWESRHGGLSTFNRELCKTIAALGHRVFCLIPAASPEEIRSAAENEVTLVVASDPALSEEVRLSTHRELPNNHVPDIIIGHGRITGPAAKALAKYHSRSRRIHFIHVAPGAIEWFKDHSTQATDRADDREQLEIALAKSASLVAAVGPLLLREFRTLLNTIRRDLFEFRPGLGEFSKSADVPSGIQCLVVGRAEDEILKGLDIAARAIGHVEYQDMARPVLMIRGAPQGHGDDLRRRLLAAAWNPDVDIRIRPFNPNADRVAEDLGQSSILLMPSRSEGFGLVGLEGIAAGVPVLLSDRSGLALLLSELVPETANTCIVKVTGDIEIDGLVWARRIDQILRNRPAAFNRADELRKRLQSLISWKTSAAEMLKALASRPTPSVSEDAGSGKLIELPLVARGVLPAVLAPPPPPIPRVADISVVRAWGWNDMRLQSAINHLDYETMDGLTSGHAGEIEQWGPVFAEHPESWRLLYAEEGQVVGYWHFVALFRDQYEQAKAGALLDINITADRVQSIELPGVYDVYFAGIALRPDYRRPSAMRILLSSLFEVLQGLAREDVFIGEICANAFTPGGVGLCKSLGLHFCVRHADHGEVYSGRLIDVLNLHLAQGFTELRALYATNQRRNISA